MKDFVKDSKPMFYLVGIMWLVFAVSLVSPINNWGIHPRSLGGIVGIALAPFLHANLGHLLGNMLAIIPLGLFFTILNRDKTGVMLGEIILLTGLLTWIIAQSEVHLGASGLVFGLLGYLILAGIIKKDTKHIVASILIFLFYGGTVLGVFPSNTGVSWESHLAGFVSGGLVARFN